MAMEASLRRQQLLANHLQPSGDVSRSTTHTDALDDICIVAATRTPITKARKGGLKDTPVDELVAIVLRSVIERGGVNAEDVDDVVVGTVLAPGAVRANECRMAMFLAGFPRKVSVRTVNRQCSSGLQAIADVAAAIQAGYINIGIAAGVEHMTTNALKWEGSVNPKVLEVPDAKSCLMPMGVTSENVAERFGVSRDVQDRFALRSHKLAAAARSQGKFKDEITPVPTKRQDPQTGQWNSVVIADDDGIRPTVDLKTLGKLPSVFKKNGSTTAGNSSQVSDGAAACLLMKRSEALKRGLPIMGVLRSFAAVGVDPAIMGVGPAAAIPVAVEKAGLQLDEIDVFEINEAFASQATYSCNKLGLDMSKVNPNGGAIALGHPLGATGTRCTAGLLYEMMRRGADCRYGVVSMCVGSGMGAAAVFERGSVVDPLRYGRTSRIPVAPSRDAVQHF